MLTNFDGHAYDYAALIVPTLVNSMMASVFLHLISR